MVVYVKCATGAQGIAGVHLQCMQNDLGKQMGTWAFLRLDQGQYDNATLNTIVDVLMWTVAAHGAGYRSPEVASHATYGDVFTLTSANANKVRYLLGQIEGNQNSIGHGGLFATTLGFDNKTLWEALVKHLREGIRIVDPKKLIQDEWGNYRFSTVGEMVGPNGAKGSVTLRWLMDADGNITINTGGWTKTRP